MNKIILTIASAALVAGLSACGAGTTAAPVVTVAAPAPTATAMTPQAYIDGLAATDPSIPVSAWNDGGVAALAFGNTTCQELESGTLTGASALDYLLTHSTGFTAAQDGSLLGYAVGTLCPDMSASVSASLMAYSGASA